MTTDVEDNSPDSNSASLLSEYLTSVPAKGSSILFEKPSEAV